jgi:soluble lytic murein transglycosylase
MEFVIIRLLSFLFLIGLLGSSAPVALASSLSIEQQRQLFIKAEGLAHNPNSRAYKRLMRQLRGYPLRPYVQLKTLTTYPFMANKKPIEEFLKEHEHSPLDKPLRKKWLSYLAKQDQSALFQHFYRQLGDVGLQCQHAQILLQETATALQGLAIAQQLWVVGKSQPKVCDPLFKAWQKSGSRSAQLVLKRISLAAKGGNHTLIPYLKTLLPKEQRYLADLWLKVRRSPSQVSRLSNFPGLMPKLESDILVYGLKRLVWRDRDVALGSLERLSARFSFSKAQQQDIAQRFALALVIINHEQAEFWLKKASALKPSMELSRWHLAHVIQTLDWQRVIELIDGTPTDIAQGNVFQYWRARAHQQLHADTLAEEGYRALAQGRHYYGFLASGKLSTMTNLNHKPLIIAQGDLDELAAYPAAQRAFEFRALKRNLSARREWNFLQTQLDPQQKLTAAVLADQWGWHDQAIFGFSKVGYLDDVDRRFPMAFRSQLLQNADNNDIDPAWAFAIARRESSFMPDAASGAGALGLMQIMPGTARYLAKKKVKRSLLFTPEKNLQLGTQYMRYLMDKLNNNAVLATASYNAGWRRVKKWLPEEQSLPLDVWIETIPYKETRNYVKAVLAYQQIYSQHLGGKENLFKELANMQIETTP